MLQGRQTNIPGGSEPHSDKVLYTILQISCSIVLCEKGAKKPPSGSTRLRKASRVSSRPKQAKAAGFAENTHPYHVQAGNWIREHRGIYRLASFPRGERPDLMLWSLWSRNRGEAAQGVYSHQTALSLYDLSDVMPAKLHMTVPKSFRRNSEIPRVLVLHFADLPQSDIGAVHGVRVTKPMRTILDLLEGGEVPLATLRQALREGLRRGLIRRSEIAEARKHFADRQDNCEPFFRK